MQLSESNKATGMQISEYIVNTFLGTQLTVLDVDTNNSVQ